MKRREFVKSMTVLAAGGVLPAPTVGSPANALSRQEDKPKNINVHGAKRNSVGPKRTLAELRSLTRLEQPEPGQPAQDGCSVYHHHLEGTWDNASWAEGHDHTSPNSPYYGDKYFDRDGNRQNQELRKAINEAFLRIKKIDLTDPDGSPWLLAWRMYPNKDHPRWGKEGFEGCGCNCGCYAPRVWAGGDDK